MKCSPGGIYGVCWGCACPQCLSDLDVLENLKTLTDSPESKGEDAWKMAMIARVHAFKEKCEKAGLVFEMQNCEVSYVLI